MRLSNRKQFDLSVEAEVTKGGLSRSSGRGLFIEIVGCSYIS